MAVKNNSGQNNSGRMISEAIRKIALGRSIERIDMAPSGMSGIGTARMIHGYVAKIHNDEGDEEFETYGGTIDVGEFPDETASSEPIIHKGVLLSGTKENNGGFLIIPTLFSDVTIVSDAATNYMYVLNFSHADIIYINSHNEVKIGVTETEELDSESNDSPDYDELEKTGNESFTKYLAEIIETVSRNKDGKEITITITPETIVQTVDKSQVSQTTDKLTHKVGGTTIVIADKKITLGAEDASEPLVLGNELANLMMEFITECTKIMTPTLMGTMPAVNAPNFAPLTSKIQKFLSKTSFTK
ncbi:hypothetical protein NXX53_06290 [Bacteroides salyersiae]|uniref:hypothetical protein n=1 Tax=Bacteroides sp. TaxID=29523 RepID=UPI0025C09503|nr:hypothetical protein [Bacteroides sp.]MCS2956885.1 hypothetical protein [Bacteroides salyersiae]